MVAPIYHMIRQRRVTFALQFTQWCSVLTYNLDNAWDTIGVYFWIYFLKFSFFNMLVFFCLNLMVIDSIELD